MNLLREYIRELLSENMCPIRGAWYGGMQLEEVSVPIKSTQSGHRGTLKRDIVY